MDPSNPVQNPILGQGPINPIKKVDAAKQEKASGSSWSKKMPQVMLQVMPSNLLLSWNPMICS